MGVAFEEGGRLGAQDARGWAVVDSMFSEHISIQTARRIAGFGEGGAGSKNSQIISGPLRHVDSPAGGFLGASR